MDQQGLAVLRSRAIGVIATVALAPLLFMIAVALLLTRSCRVLEDRVCEDADGQLFRTRTFAAGGPVGDALASTGLDELPVFLALARGDVVLSEPVSFPQSMFHMIRNRKPSNAQAAADNTTASARVKAGEARLAS